MALFQSIRAALSKTRRAFSSQFSRFLGLQQIDEDTLEHLSNVLLKADFGIHTTEAILSQLPAVMKEKGMDVLSALKHELLRILNTVHRPFEIKSTASPRVILFVGINGAGKTTSIGKLGAFLQAHHQSVLFAAGDTFRAAAIEQLAEWAHRNHAPLVAQNQGSDSASVIFDAIDSARAKQKQVVLADTAGRLHTKDPLMNELKKVARVIKKMDETAPHEVILVLDASIGQNALQQVREFNAILPLTGLILTKLDGTAKGGILFAIAEQTQLPVYFIGTGEGLHDFQAFDPASFIHDLFEE